MFTMSESLASWQRAWRVGIVPHLPRRGLEALRRALEHNDPRLLQGRTTDPPPLPVCHDWPLARADAIAFALWHGEGRGTVGGAEEGFAQVCHRCDLALGEPAACRFWLAFWDDTPMEEIRRLLLPELDLILNREVSHAG